jgi:hypothetical protein
MGKNTVSFVELNLSNETKAFIDGPELGGAAPDGTTTISPTPQPTSMGCFCHTIGLSLLVWTVLVPTVIAVGILLRSLCFVCGIRGSHTSGGVTGVTFINSIIA